MTFVNCGGLVDFIPDSELHSQNIGWLRVQGKDEINLDALSSSRKMIPGRLKLKDIDPFQL